MTTFEGARRATGWLHVVGLFLLLAVAWPARAQEPADLVPRNEEAESIFRQALDAFTEGDYGMAYRRFRLVVDGYPFNRKTTAAMLMAAKALYRDGEYQRAADLAEEFLRGYPTSGYIGEAEQLLGYARERMGLDEARTEVINLGIALPLEGEDAALTQALFNGIRIAVDEHNNAPGQRRGRVRMVFRDTKAQGATARAAVTALARDEQVGAIVGPLYSEEAEAAGAAAEQAGVVLVAPMATDEAVSQGREYVFQANPTITMRGRLMARFALRSLRLESFGVIAELNNSISERMAEGFQEEALQQGAEVPLFMLLPNARGWSMLPDELTADTLQDMQAVYLAISGNNATARVGDALLGFDAILPTPAARSRLRLLGNSEWHDLPVKVQASQYLASYTNDFFVDKTREEVQHFINRYRELSGEEPDRLAYAGYDVTRYLVMHMTNQPDQPLREVLHEAPPYEGLGNRIDFQEGNVNEAMFYHRYRNGEVELVR